MRPRSTCSKPQKLCNLEKKLHRVLAELLESSKPLSADSTIDDTVVVRGSDGHNRDSLELRLAVLRGVCGVGHDLDIRGTNSEDTSLGRVDNSGEVLDAEHTKVGDSEGAALVLVGLELVLSGLLGERLHLGRDTSEALEVSVGDDGGDEASISGDRNRDINIVVVADVSLLPRAVDLRNLLEGSSGSLDDEVVDGELGGLGVGLLSLLSELLVKISAKLVDSVHLDLDGDVVVGDALLGLSETLGNDLAHHRSGLIDVVTSGASRNAGRRQEQEQQQRQQEQRQQRQE